MPGVSTKTICAAPWVAMPRTMARVVCTLWVTIDTLAPTSWLTSVDLPAFGAPISATKPERVSAGGCLGVAHVVASVGDQMPSRTRKRGAAAPCSASRLERTAALRGVQPVHPHEDGEDCGAWSGPVRLDRIE
jgi:hypothetical protein